MSRAFVIPDVHLKPWMFEKADKLVAKGKFEDVVMLGDLVDDWGQGKNEDLCNETFDAAVAFVKKHPNTHWCYGNHDVSYLWGYEESGYSFIMRNTVVQRIRELEAVIGPGQAAFVHRIDDVCFSHGGIVDSFIQRNFGDQEPNLDEMIRRINIMDPEELWKDDSPLWARPDYWSMEPYANIRFQVVGHTPVRQPTLQGNLIITDTFSTYWDGRPVGNEAFVWIDTMTFVAKEIT